MNTQFHDKEEEYRTVGYTTKKHIDKNNINKN